MATEISGELLSAMENGKAPQKVSATPSPTDSSQNTTTWGSKEETLNPADCVRNKTLVERIKSAFAPKPSPKRGPETIVKTLEDCARGYPLLAAFLDSDENFMIYRRFGFLHSRLLLYKQDELRSMEEELNDMDRKDQNGDDPGVLQCREDDDARSDLGPNTRRSLFHRIEETLLKYDEILLYAQKLIATNRPGERDYKSVKNFMWNKKPLMEGDAEFIYNKDDLITLRPGRETAWLDTLVEGVLKIFPRKPIQHLFCSKETARKSNDPDIRYFTKSRVERLVNVVILIMILALLVLPVYALYHISIVFNNISPNTSNAVCIGILLVSTLIFSAVLSLFTKARRHEILGASAAYCAILVVFIGNIDIQNVQFPH